MSFVAFYRRCIATIDRFLTQIQKRSCPNPSSKEEIEIAIAAIKSKKKEINAMRKAGA